MPGQALSTLLAILCILFSLGLISFLVGSYVYKRMHNLPTGDCACSHINAKKILKEYRKKKSNSHE